MGCPLSSPPGFLVFVLKPRPPTFCEQRIIDDKNLKTNRIPLSFLRIRAPLNWSRFAPRLGATLAASGGNAQLRQKPSRQEYVDDNKSDRPNPIRHVSSHLLRPPQVYAGTSSSDTSL